MFMISEEQQGDQYGLNTKWKKNRRSLQKGNSPESLGTCR